MSSEIRKKHLLNITPINSPTARGVQRKSLKGKRKRTFIEETEETDVTNFSVNSTSKGDIAIAEVCTLGKFVRLINKGNKDVSLSGWQLVRKAGDSSTVFKFHRTLKIEPGATVTVWSADTTDVNHEPPYNLLMKGQKWVTSDTMTTALLNGSGEEVALSEVKKQILSDKISKRQDEIGGLTSSKRPLISSIRSTESQGEERCIIM